MNPPFQTPTDPDFQPLPAVIYSKHAIVLLPRGSGRCDLSTLARSVWQSCSLARQKPSLKAKKRLMQIRGRDPTRSPITFLISPQCPALGV